MSGGAPLNPYESPVIPVEAAVAESPVSFAASFLMDDLGLLASARANTAPIHPWLLWTAPFWLCGLAFFFVSMALFAGAGFALAIGTLSLIALTLFQAGRDFLVARQTLQLLRAHPVLGSLGLWRLSVDTDELFVETPGGRQRFTLRNISSIAEENRRLLIWFGDNLPIVIPKHPGYTAMMKQLRRWAAGIKTTPPPTK